MNVLFFGSYDSDRHPRVRVLVEGFGAWGDEIHACNVPLAVDAESRLALLKRPWRAPIFAARLARVWKELWRLARDAPQPDVVVIGYMGHFDVHLARRIWPDRPIALDHLLFAAGTAVDRRVRSRPLLRLLARLDRAAVRAADLPFVDTEEHRADLPAEVRGRACVVPVGAPEAWFNAGYQAPATDVARLRVVFYGLYTPLQGAPTIGSAINLLRDEQVEFTMIGRGQDYEETRLRSGSSPKVHWVDWVDPDSLPACVAAHDVCLGIFGTGQKARKVVPNKVYQGAAAGCAIVTSNTKPQRRAMAEAGCFVEAGDPVALAQALRRLDRDRARLRERRRAARQRALSHFRPPTVVWELRDRLQSGGLQDRRPSMERKTNRPEPPPGP